MWCGQNLSQVSLPVVPLACPVCNIPLVEHQSEGYAVHFCGQCKGLWVTSLTLTYLETQFDRVPPPSTKLRVEAPIDPLILNPEATQLYRRCPQCNQQMARQMYRRISGVIVDSCLGHGVWFDANEMQAVLRFLGQGGLEASRIRERDLAANRQSVPVVGTWGATPGKNLLHGLSWLWF
jgi:Zn-finger nucleic acid-binding protein